jgi:hypothetical protein
MGLALMDLRRRHPFLVPAGKKALVLLFLTSVVTVIGAVWAIQYSDTLALWTQSPATRAIRETSRYAVLWLLPIAFAMPLRNSTETRILIRDFMLAGIAYSALGVVQFAVGITTGVDLFPVIRTFNDSIQLQDMVGLRGQGRITSICGEPRAFSCFLTIWFVFTVACGKAAGFTLWQIRSLSALFLGVNILTGSRTGLVQLVLILIALMALCFPQRNREFIRRTFEIVLVASAGLLVIAFVQGLVIKERAGLGEDNMNDQVQIAGLSLPIEFQDKQAFLLFVERPLNLLAGAGAGLWQYQSDPYENEGFRRNFFDQGVLAIDSIRQNITLLAVMSDFGLFGIFLLIQFYRLCFRLAEKPGGLAVQRQFKSVVSILLVGLVISSGTDTYCNVMVFLVFTLWYQTGTAAKLHAMQVAAAAYNPSEAYA